MCARTKNRLSLLRTVSELWHSIYLYISTLIPYLVPPAAEQSWATIILAYVSIYTNIYLVNFAGNKAKGQILKLVFQENKAHQIYRKTNISYLLIRTRTCAYQGVKNVRSSENLTFFVFLKDPFWVSLFMTQSISSTFTTQL